MKIIIDSNIVFSAILNSEHFIAQHNTDKKQTNTFANH